MDPDRPRGRSSQEPTAPVAWPEPPADQARRTTGAVASQAAATSASASALGSALEHLAESTAADLGAVMFRDVGVAARYGAALTHAADDALTELDAPREPIVASVQFAPLPEALRKQLADAGIADVAIASIQDGERQLGSLLLGWSGARNGQTEDTQARAADTHARAQDTHARAAILSPALRTASAHLAALIENAELRALLARRDEAHRKLADQLSALQELTRIGEAALTFPELAARTAARVSDALGAAGTQYGVLHPDGTFESAAMVGIDDHFATIHRTDTGLPMPHTTLVGDGRPAVQAFDRRSAGPRTVQAAEAAGYAAYAAIPVHVEGRLAAALMCVFDRSPDELGLDPGMLDAVARIASISLTNFRRRERLESALATERRVVGLRQALESLTVVGETATGFGQLADATLRQVVSILGARHGVYAEIGRDGAMSAVGTSSAGFPFEQLERLTPLRRYLETGPAYIQAFEPGVVPDAALDVARANGIAAYAALPVHDRGELAGAIAVFFDRPAPTLRIEQRELDTIARIASISLSNFRLRQRLVASEGRYRTLFEESPEPLILATLDGTITDANEASIRLFGDDQGWLVGRSLREVIEWGTGLQDQRVRQLTAAGRLALRGQGTQSGGSHFPYEVVVHRVDVGGEPRLLLLVRDLTDEQRLQQELVQAQKMEAIGMLVSGVAHELNNPLAAIGLFSHLLARDPRLPEDLRHDADLFVRETDRTRRIVQNLLDFARQRPPERHPTRLHVLVQTVLDLQSYSLNAGQVEVVMDVSPDLAPVELDRAQMQQVLLNLTQNAIQSTAGGAGPARIRIGARKRLRSDGEDVVWLSVDDNGPGVPPDLRDRLFLPFFTTKEPGKGTGLGLSVSFGIVAAHGGHLWFEAPPDGGARFVIELPFRATVAGPAEAQKDGGAAEPTAAEAARAAQAGAGLAHADTSRPTTATAPPDTTPAKTRADTKRHGDPKADTPTSADLASTAVAARSPKIDREPVDDAYADAAERADGQRPWRILILDDEPAIRTLLEKTLRNAGWDPLVTSDGIEAVNAAEREHIDILLVDHRMAGMSGTEVYEAIAERRPELANRFIFMSGDVLNPELRTFVQKHNVGLLAKPFDLATVQGAIRDLLREVGSAR